MAEAKAHEIKAHEIREQKTEKAEIHKTEEAEIHKTGVMGLDTGGTFTDVVFISDEDNTVIAKGKTPTLHDNLAATVENGVDIILEKVAPSAVRSFSIATTLATNAIVENRTRPTALFLIGYEEDTVQAAVKENAFNTEYVYMISGGHDNWGNEKRPLDEEKIRGAALALPQGIEAAAVSGFFSVRNNAHEKRAVEIIKELRPELYISCGYELTTELNAVKRATTAVLNAGLIPITMEFFDAVEQACRKRKMTAEINVVKGDGSLVNLQWAKLYPVEMILSGPAGSACGAQFLADLKGENRPSWVIDIGGTTTDIIRLDEDGRPALLESGITVAGHKTLTKAIDIYTFGLGGDSRVLLDRCGCISLGNRRVIPLCKLALKHPEVLKELKALRRSGYMGEPLFIISKTGSCDSEFEQSIIDKLEKGPQSLQRILGSERHKSVYRNAVKNMYEKGYVEYSSFTPTDALNVKGTLQMGVPEASEEAAWLMINDEENTSPEAVADDVCRKVVMSICRQLISRNFEVHGVKLTSESENLIRSVLAEENGMQRLVSFFLDAGLIGVGAPSWAFMPAVGEKVNEPARLPQYAEVAGAAGAAMGSFYLSHVVEIIPVYNTDIYRIHYPGGTADYEDADKAVAFVCGFMKKWLAERAMQAGALNPEVKWVREDEKLQGIDYSADIRPWIKVKFTVTDTAAV